MPSANRYQLFVPAIVAGLHLLLCIAIGTGIIRSEGSWSWFIVFFIDFPFSILLLPLQNWAGPLLAFGILGSAWWFAMTWSVLYLWFKIAKRSSVDGDRVRGAS